MLAGWRFKFAAGVIVGAVMIPGGAALAQTTGAALEYTVTVTKVELCSDVACTTSVTVGESTKTFDIAGANAGAAVGSYASLDAIQPGFIAVAIRTTLLRDITVRGTANAVPGVVAGGGQDTNCRTSADNSASVSQAEAGNNTIGFVPVAQRLTVPSPLAFDTNGIDAGPGLVEEAPTAAGYNAAGIVLTGTSMTFTATLAAPISFTAGNFPNIKVTFNTQAALGAIALTVADAGDQPGVGGDCLMLPQAPSISVTVN